MNFMDTLGLIGAFIVTYSNIPQMFLFFKQGHAQGISISSTWIGTIGLLLRTAYIIHTAGLNLILLGPYFFAILSCIITLYYIHYPRVDSGKG